MAKKIIIGFVAFFTLILITLIAIPFLFKDKINERIKVEINKQLLADVNYSKFDLSIIRSFPDFTFSLYDLTVIGRDFFEGDTLIQLDEFKIGLDIKSVLGEEIKVHSILIDHPRILALSIFNEDLNGKISNYHILPSTEDVESEETSSFNIDLKSFVVKNAGIYFYDAVNDYEVYLQNLNLTSSVNYRDGLSIFNANLFLDSLRYGNDDARLAMSDISLKTIGDYTEEAANTVSNLTVLNMNYRDGKTYYLNKAQVNLDLDAEVDLIKNIFRLKDNELSINNLKLQLDGLLALKENDDIDVDVTFNTNQNNFKEVLSLVPPEYLKDYEGLKASGIFDLSGFAKGIYNENSMPLFGLNFAVQNGSIQYPDLPTGISNIDLTAKVNSPTSDMQQLSVHIPNARFSMLNENIVLSLKANQLMTDPLIDTKIKGKLNLAKVPDFYPLEGVNQIAGMLDADILFKGKLSDIENELYNNVDFSGNLLVTNFLYDDATYPKVLKLDVFALDFSPQFANLTSLKGNFGKTDFDVTGRLENFINYALADGVLSGNLNMKSNFINLDELMTDGGNTEEASEDEIVKVAKNINFKAALTSNKILYDGLDLNNVVGNLLIKDETVTLENLATNLLGGFAKINGSYSTKGEGLPQFDLTYNINKFNIQESFNYLNTVQKIAPIAQYLTGTFSSEMSVNSLLNPDLSVNLSALSGDGEIRIPFATITKLPLFDKISQVVKIPGFDKPEINDGWTVLKFTDGRVKVDPFEVKSKNMIMFIEGSNGFDETIDYDIRLQVPSDKFGGAASVANDFLSKQNIPLFNLSVPQNINFHLKADGLLRNPSLKIIKVSAGESGKGIKDQIKDTAKEELERAKQKAQEELDKQRQKAEDELDKQKQAAQDEIEKQKQRAKDEAQKAKEEAEKKAREEAEKAKEDIKDKVKDKFKGFGF